MATTPGSEVPSPQVPACSLPSDVHDSTQLGQHAPAPINLYAAIPSLAVLTLSFFGDIRDILEEPFIGLVRHGK